MHIVLGAVKALRLESEEHYYDIHHVVLQPSCCAPPSVFQTIRNCDCDKGISAPTRLTERSSEKE